MGEEQVNLSDSSALWIGLTGRTLDAPIPPPPPPRESRALGRFPIPWPRASSSASSRHRPMGDMGGAQARGWGSCQVLAAVLSLSPRLLGAAPAECGKPAVTGKIFGGENAPELRWPWQVSLLYQNRHVCGAALIDAFWVLSAAHCFQLSHTPDDYKVLLGYHKLQQPSKHSLVRTLHHVIVHPDFNKTHFLANDIALLQLRVPVNFSLHVLPACLQKPNETLQTGKTCWVTGWGMITEAGRLWRAAGVRDAGCVVPGGAVQLEHGLSLSYRPQHLHQTHLLLPLDQRESEKHSRAPTRKRAPSGPASRAH
ncbi:serine protease 40-like [Erinaceus europaeus]|uniref:Serine protease 40-like n=1 Tax=Erinaceus europaeus TaxID=9365 RepID=A0ABM3WBX7_ERIEU|nr:serine protease 40-like [Erinaceus europaeus]